MLLSFRERTPSVTFKLISDFFPRLQKFFGDEYYGEDEGEKPQFDDDDELEGESVFFSCSLTLKPAGLI